MRSLKLNAKVEKDTDQGGNFAFGNIVEISVILPQSFYIKNHSFKAKVIGKVKNAEAYVIGVRGATAENHKELKRKYGYPIRQIELEWGKFSGNLNEYIISRHELIKIG